MTILVDIDGVIFNTQETLLDWLNEKYKTEYKFGDIISYDWFDKTFIDPWEQMEYEEFWNNVKANEQAIDYILKWKHEGHTIKFVTASYYHYNLPTKIHKLLNSFNGEFNDKDVIICHDKGMVLGTLLIDDCFDNCQNFNNYSIVYKQPWNENYIEKNGVFNPILFRTDNWELIEKMIKMIQKSYDLQTP